MKAVRTYNSQLRQSQAEATRERILAAMAELYERDGEAATVRAVAERAGVREITVYRHFPNRDELMKGLWAWLNRKHGVTVGMPETAEQLVAQIAPLFATFGAAPAHVAASLRSPEGQKVRNSLNAERAEAFLAILEDVAPDLAPNERRKAASVLQLLYSAHTWISMREQWGLDDAAAAEAAGWAAEHLIADLRARGSAPIRPGETGPADKEAQS